MSSVFFRNLRLFHSEEKGVVLIIFLLVVVPLLLVIAIGIDFSQALVVKRQLSTAVDAAALAIGSKPNLTDPTDLQLEAETYIKANYPDAGIGTLKNFTVTRTVIGPREIEIDVAAEAEVPTTLMKIGGVDTLTINVNSKVVIGAKTLELVMVLDNSGSMSEGGKLAAMKTAANTLVSFLFGPDVVSDKIKVGLVPFTGAVNVKVPETTPWLDLNNPAPILTYLTLPAGESAFNVFAVMNGGISANWAGCLRSRANPHDTQDTVPSAAAPATLFSGYFDPKPIGAAKSVYAGLTAGPITDPNSPNYRCPAAPIQALTNVSTTITTAVNAMTAEGSTNIANGLAWGWRLISADVPFTEGAPYSDQEAIKAIILLTDGNNNVSGTGNYTSYGFGGNDNPQLGPDVNVALDLKTTEVCNNIKADKDGDPSDNDILIYTIVFNVTSGPIVTLMQNCATDPGKFFNSPTATALQSAFQTIAASLNQLRIAQ